MTTGRWASLLVVVAAAAFAVWFVTFSDGPPPAGQPDAQEGPAPPSDPPPRDRPFDRFQRQSASLMPRVLAPLALGMTEATIRRHRPGVRPRPDSRDVENFFLEERLENGAVVVYGFRRSTGLLHQIQVMSLLSDHALLPTHLADMVRRYDRPSGLFLCPDTGGVPTLRFLWRRSAAAVADVLLFYGDRVSVTFHLASDETMRGSFTRSGCRPAALEELRDRFPLATVEQLRRATQ